MRGSGQHGFAPKGWAAQRPLRHGCAILMHGYVGGRDGLMAPGSAYHARSSWLPVGPFKRGFKNGDMIAGLSDARKSSSP